MAFRALILATLVLALSASGAAAGPSSSTVRIVLGGDVMLGRGLARLAARDPDAVFAGIRLELGSADLAVANLESPLTNRAHRASHGPNALEARPATARILAAAGFDAMAIANNHAGDAGPATVPDTMRALRAAGLGVIGAGSTAEAAYTPRIVHAHGLTIAFLSFDDTGEGPRAGPATPGVAWWNARRARAAVDTRPLGGRHRRRRPPRRLGLQPDDGPMAASPRAPARGLGRGHRLGHGAARRPTDRARPRQGRPRDGHRDQPRQPRLRPVDPGDAERRAARGPGRQGRRSRLQARRDRAGAVERGRVLALARAPRECGCAARRVVAARDGAGARAHGPRRALRVSRQGRRRRDRRPRGQRGTPARGRRSGAPTGAPTSTR